MLACKVAEQVPGLLCCRRSRRRQRALRPVPLHHLPEVRHDDRRLKDILRTTIANGIKKIFLMNGHVATSRH
jgi:5,10-methylenetetrahydrofolate reductase